MTEKTRLFFIINCYSMGGGAEALLTMIMNALDDTGKYEIGVMEIIHCDVKQEPINDTIKVYPYFTKADASDRQKRMYYVFHEWDKVIKKYVPDDYDVYISFNYLRPTFLLPAGKRNISWIHSDVYDLINKYPNQTKDLSEERELQRVAFRKVNRIIAISDITLQSIRDIFPEYIEKTILLPNGIDVLEVRKKSNEKTDVILVGYSIVVVGRLEPRKNPIRALDIFREVLKNRNDAHLYYLGYGQLEDDLKKQVADSGLVDRVHILGYYDNPFPIIKQARLMLMTSYSEGFPMCLLESVALGIPFVSTIVGGSRMLCKDKAVGAVFDNDHEAVSEIIKFSRTDPQIIQAACDSVCRQYDISSYIENIERIISEVLSEEEMAY